MIERTWQCVLCSLALGVMACGDEAAGPVPAAGDCNKTHTAGRDATALQVALDRASFGDCVVLESETYTGNFHIPGGVTLVAAKGATPVLTSATAEAPVVWIKATSGGSLLHVTISESFGTGILITGGAAVIEDVTVYDTREGIAAVCAAEDCLGEGQLIVLNRVTAEYNATGLYSEESRVEVTDSMFTDSDGDLPGTAYGILAGTGTQLSMADTTISRSGFVGLAAAGAATTVTATNLVIIDNTDHGVLLQDLAGTNASPAFSLTASQITTNRLAGLMTFNTTGVLLNDVTIEQTLIGDITVGVGGTAGIGDGVALLDGTGDVVMESVTLANNGRCQLIVDHGSTGIQFNGGTVTIGTGQYGIVVQNTGVSVDVPTEHLESLSDPLPVPAG